MTLSECETRRSAGQMSYASSSLGLRVSAWSCLASLKSDVLSAWCTERAARIGRDLVEVVVVRNTYAKFQERLDEAGQMLHGDGQTCYERRAKGPQNS